MAIHAQARQLARYGRIRTRRSRGAMSGSPHRRQANPRPRSHRMAGTPHQAPRQSRLAIHNRHRPRPAEETVPSVRVTRATSYDWVPLWRSALMSARGPQISDFVLDIIQGGTTEEIGQQVSAELQ